ncbi:MAG: LLM class F420-dependent oxidoreductase [Deltaproteobacteria bacterium]|nr:LLM class F420-dependent oxidoreductase [Deltaproteobacteria bacterium]
MRFWQSVAFAAPDEVLELARIAERVGFHGVFCSEHVFFPERLASKYPYSPDGAPLFTAETPWLDPWVQIAAMAAVTRTLRFVTGVYILPLRHPLEVAKTVASVALLSGDRVGLGVGAGWMREEFDVLGRAFAGRGKRMDEQIAILRKVWAGGMVEHHGAHYAFPRLQLSPAPRTAPPILIGGQSEAAFKRAARLGDGWVGSGHAPEQVLEVMRRLQELRREAGRERAPFDAILVLSAPAGLDDLRRFEDAGVTSLVSWPLTFTLGPQATMDEKRRYLETYANDVIAKIG